MKLGKDATPRQVAESYWRAECAHDIEGVGQHYHADAIFMPPGERLLGWPSIRKWYEEAFRQFPGLEVDIVHEVRQGNEAALEWKAVLIDPAGVRHPLTGVNVVRVKDGKYLEVRAYFDASKLNVKRQT
jgi:ketosteroid isomerase-like protein